DASPIAQSPEYVPESDFEVHPEDDDDEDPEEDPVDYPADGGDDGDDEEESSEDEEDDEIDVEADEEEDEEEHPAPADSVVVASTVADQAPSAEEKEPFKTDEEDRPEVTLPPRKRLDIALGPRYEVGESSSATAARPAGELSGYVREFETRVRQDMDEIYTRLDDEQTEEAWVRATNASDLVHAEVMSLRTTMLGQMSEIRELQAADRRRQTVISELLRIDHRRSTEISELRAALQGQGQVTALQGQVTALQVQVTTLQGNHGLAGDPTQPELPEEAGGSA
nr:hypothetical protein [Tanacetum cinerariifolium]